MHLSVCLSVYIFEDPPRQSSWEGRDAVADYNDNDSLIVQSHFMRNGVLGVFGELVVQLLSGSELSDQQRNTREQLLDNLQVMPQW